MDLWKSKTLVAVLLVLTFVLSVFLFLISRWDSIERVFPQVRQLTGESASTNTPQPSPAQDYSYTNTIPGEKNQKLQINGVIESIGTDWLVIVAKEQRYTISTTPESYMECREEYMKDISGKQIPAYSIFLDLTWYILNLDKNGRTLAQNGQLLYFSDTKERIEKDKHALAVIDAGDPSQSKGNTLFFLIVYGCT